MKRIALVAVVAVVSVLGASLAGQTGRANQPSATPADLVLRNGRVVTVDDAKPEGQTRPPSA